MSASKIYVDDELLVSFQQFIATEKIAILLTADKNYSKKILVSDEVQKKCEKSFLFQNGSIDCVLAYYWADELKITLNEMGKLLNFLNIKICRCQLGCF